MKERWYALNGWSVVILGIEKKNKTAQIRGYDVEGTKVKDCNCLDGLKLLLDVDYNWKLMVYEVRICVEIITYSRYIGTVMQKIEHMTL